MGVFLRPSRKQTVTGHSTLLKKHEHEKRVFLSSASFSRATSNSAGSLI